MNLLQYDIPSKSVIRNIPTFSISMNPKEDWIPFMAMFSNSMLRNSLFCTHPLSRIHEISNNENFRGYKKSSSRSKLRLIVFPHMWFEIVDGENVKILWSLMVHKNYVKQQIGSLLTCGKLIPEYTQLHVRSEFSHYTYKSPTLRKSFMENIYKAAEDEGVKIYEKKDFKQVFLNFVNHVDTLKELKQIKQTIIDELQKT